MRERVLRLLGHAFAYPAMWFDIVSEWFYEHAWQAEKASER